MAPDPSPALPIATGRQAWLWSYWLQSVSDTSSRSSGHAAPADSHTSCESRDDPANIGVSILAARTTSHGGLSLLVLLGASSGEDPKLTTHTTFLSYWPANSNRVMATVILLCLGQMFTHHDVVDSYGLQPQVFHHTVEHLILWSREFKEHAL